MKFKSKCVRCESAPVQRDIYCKDCWDWISNRAWNELVNSLEKDLMKTA